MKFNLLKMTNQYLNSNSNMNNSNSFDLKTLFSEIETIAKETPENIKEVNIKEVNIKKGKEERVVDIDDIDDNINLQDYVEQPWAVINSYFRGKHLRQLVKHQVESYNDFVNYQIKKTISMFNPVQIRSDQDYVKEVDKYRLEMFVTFEEFNIYRPQIHENNGATKLMFPQEARLRNFTYAANMSINMNIKYIVRTGPLLESEQTFYKVLPNIHIGKLPVMLKSSICILEQYKHIPHTISGECKLDSGGYFIINGSEKTCLGQERAAENLVQCFNVSKNNSKWNWLAEIKSVPDFKCISPKQISLMMTAKNNGFGHGMWLQIPRVKIPLPLFVIFRALGIISDQEICQKIVLDTNHERNKALTEGLQASIVEANKYLTQECAMKYITNNVMYTPLNMDKETGAKKKREFALDVINTDLFPHCKTMDQKIYFLGYMTNCLLKCSLKWEETDDRDSYLNKRIDLTGTLLNNLFRNYFNKLVKDMQKQVIREINNGSWRSTEDYNGIINMTNIYKIVKSTTIENGLKRALATGDFGIKHSNTNKVGVAQVLNRLTYISSLSHLRRINTPIDKSGKLIPPRKLHSTSWGFLCPAETPEGGSVGVVKNLSYMTHVTTPCNSAALYDFVEPYLTSIETLSPELLHDKVKIFINGSWLGIATDPFELYQSLKTKKYKGIINIYTSIIFDIPRKEIRVCNDAGRLMRPLLRVKGNNLLLTKSIIKKLNKQELNWDDLLTDGRTHESVIEYVDSAEQNLGMIAMEPIDLKISKSNFIYKYTHCEIHPSTIFGILASCIPFPEHNQSPRNTYQCAMGKQAMGMYVTNYDNRMDKTAYVMTYPMRPLVDTRVMNLIELNQIPSGSQIIVAIMTHSGYNQEDSILFNQGSIDRGLFQATIYHTEKDEDKKIHGDEEIRCKPDPSKTKGMKFGNYDKINSAGVIPENTLVENRDIIIGKVLPIKDARNDHTKVTKYEDQSRIFRTTEETYIDKNYIERNGDGYNFCKVRLRTLRKPIIGDKFSSRHGQKGTIGNIIPECDMPFTDAGIRPDIIINPHAIPSRMTIAQLKETILGKTLLELGLFGDGTSFGKFDVKDICKELQKVGYESTGNELMYNGLTGEQFETSIFIGPVFYQRLKHMVSDKQHSRSIGPMVNLTRQPAEGRSKDGGLRFGEMERDCMCSHGASRFTKGRIYDASDAFRVHVCKRCGLIAAYNDQLHIHHCKTCDNRVDFDYVELPYSCKLLFQELITMNIAPRIMT
jgi:DNA-directed RNA polymerase II subunit RPB2